MGKMRGKWVPIWHLLCANSHPQVFTCYLFKFSQQVYEGRCCFFHYMSSGNQDEPPAWEHQLLCDWVAIRAQVTLTSLPLLFPHSLLPLQKLQIHASHVLISPCILKAQPLPPSATFLFSSSSQMSFVPHKGLESHTLDYLVSFSRTAGNKYVSLKFHKKKKNIYALAPSNQIPSEPPSPTSSFHWFSTKQQKTLVIFRVITSKLHLKVKHTLC